MDNQRYTLNYDIIGKRVKQARKAISITQAQLAELINVNTNTIAKLESNCTTISLQTMIKLANTLNVDLNYLMIEEKDNIHTPLDLLITSMINDFDKKDKELLLTILTAIKSYKNKIL